MKHEIGLSAKELATLEAGFSRDWHMRKIMEKTQKEVAKARSQSKPTEKKSPRISQ